MLEAQVLNPRMLDILPDELKQPILIKTLKSKQEDKIHQRFMFQKESKQQQSKSETLKLEEYFSYIQENYPDLQQNQKNLETECKYFLKLIIIVIQENQQPKRKFVKECITFFDKIELDVKLKQKISSYLLRSFDKSKRESNQ